MSRLTYWCADCLNDSRAYNIRRKTRKQVQQALESWGTPGEWVGNYSSPYKVIVQYTNTLDLIDQALGEGGIENDSR